MILHLHFAEAHSIPVLFQGLAPVDQLPGHSAFVRRALAVSVGAGDIVLLGVFANRAARGKARRQPGHAFPHARHPGGGNTALISLIKLRDYFAFQQVIESFGFRGVPGRVLTMLVSVAQSPTHVGTCTPFVTKLTGTSC